MLTTKALVKQRKPETIKVSVVLLCCVVSCLVLVCFVCVLFMYVPACFIGSCVCARLSTVVYVVSVCVMGWSVLFCCV